MPTTTYSTVITDTQHQVVDILKNDSTVLTYTNIVLDGFPSDLLKRRAFPFILVRTPTVSEENLTISSKKSIDITLDIEIYAGKEGMGREVADAVRAALYNNRNTTKDRRLYWQNISSTDLDINALPNAKKPFYIYTITLEYTAVLS